MNSNRLQAAMERLDALRLELERDIITDLDRLYFGHDAFDVTDHVPTSGIPWQVFGDGGLATAVDTTNNITWSH